MNRLTNSELAKSINIEKSDDNLVRYHKLGKYEDLDKELGIEYPVLIKALKNGVFTKFNNRIDFHRVISFRKYDDKIRMLYGGFYCMELEDYGKTWALTREELENDK